MTLVSTVTILQIVLDEIRSRPSEEVLLQEIGNNLEQQIADLGEYIALNPQIP